MIDRIIKQRQVRRVTENEKAMQFVRFCIVGGICFVISTAIFHIVNSFTPLGRSISVTLAYFLSLAVNYILSVKWTFKVRASKGNAAGIVCAHILNYGFQQLLMYLFVVVAGISFFWHGQDVGSTLAFIITNIITSITNFFVIRFVVKKTSKN